MLHRVFAVGGCAERRRLRPSVPSRQYPGPGKASFPLGANRTLASPKWLTGLRYAPPPSDAEIARAQAENNAMLRRVIAEQQEAAKEFTDVESGKVNRGIKKESGTPRVIHTSISLTQYLVTPIILWSKDVFLCLNEPINPRNDAGLASTVFATAPVLLTAGRFSSDGDLKAVIA